MKKPRFPRIFPPKGWDRDPDVLIALAEMGLTPIHLYIGMFVTIVGIGVVGLVILYLLGVR